MIKKVLTLITILQCCLFAGFAGIENYNIKSYDKNSDFFGDFVYTIVQDNSGYLWVGTDQGLHQFDGKNLININRKDSTINNLVTASVVPSDKGLLFGYLKGGLSSYKNGKYNKIFTEKDIRNKIIKIEENSNGTYWVLTQNEGIIRVKKDSLNNYDYTLLERTLLKNKNCHDFEIYEDNLFLATNEGLIHYKLDKHDKLKSLGMVKGTEYIPILALFTDHLRSRHALWVGTEEHGLMNLKLDTTVFEIKNHEILTEMTIHSIAEDDFDNLWVGTKLKGLIKINFNVGNKRELQYTFFNKGNGFPSNEIRKVFIDRENEIWVGTFGSGLVQITEKYIHQYELNTKLKTEGINAIEQLNHTNLVLGTENGLVKTFHHNSLDSLNFEYSEYLKGQKINTILHSKTGAIWVGTDRNGLFKFSPDLENQEKIYIGKIDGESERIRYLTEDLEGNIWASIKGNGVIKIDVETGRIKKYNTRNQFYHNEIYHIFPDSKGRIWFSARSAGIALMKTDGSMNYLTRDGEIPLKDVNTIKEDLLGNIWITTYGMGLWKYDGEKLTQYQKKGGLMSDYCNSLAIDLKNNIWVSHRMGISNLNTETGLIKTFNNKNIMGENEVLLNSTFTDDVGDIWFGNAFGITKVDKPHLNFHIKNLNTLITNVRIDHKEEDLWKYSKSDVLQGFVPTQLYFPHDKNNIAFDFIAIHFRTPDAVHYQYKLEGFDKEWSEILRDNKANYTNLPAGNYKFIVRESEDPNYWKEEITSVAFAVSAAYWKTIWFTVAELAILLVLIFATITLSRKIENKILTKLLIFACVFSIFEYIHTQFEPYMDDIAGGPAIFQVLINLLLGIMLFPVESSIMKYLNKKKMDTSDKSEYLTENNLIRNIHTSDALNRNVNSAPSLDLDTSQTNRMIVNVQPEKKTDYNQILNKYLIFLEFEPNDYRANYNVGAIHINLAKSFYKKAKKMDLASGNMSRTELIKKGDKILEKSLSYIEKANTINTSIDKLKILRQVYKQLKMYDKTDIINHQIDNLQLNKEIA